MCSYLKNRKQRMQINNYFRSEKKVIARVPQGSIDGPLLFDLFLNDLVLFLPQYLLNKCAGDNNLLRTEHNLELAKIDLQTDFKAITNWFFENYMILNSDKCHDMGIGKSFADVPFIHNGKKFKNCKEETTLGVIIENKITFDSHINKTCKKAGQKFSAIS